MNYLAKTALLASAAFIAVPGLLAAQEATFVLTARDVGAPSYDPIKGTRLNDAISLIYDRLVLQDTDQSYHGQLAESWESAPDGMEWTFKLRPGVTFHNGEPFNARTIEWWVPKFKGTENSFMIDAIETVEVVDDLTVKFVMKTPDPNLLFNLASTFMSVPEPTAYDRLGDQFGVTEAVGTGPFKLEQFTVGQQTILVRNDDYAWASDLSTNKGPAKIARLEVREIAEDSTAFLELQTGGVDLLLRVPTDFLPRLESEEAVEVVTLPGTEMIYMPINTSVEPFTDIKVRQAAALAVNQQEITTSLFGGVGLPAHTFLIDSLLESQVAPEFQISFDLEKANSLLEEAGWAMGSDGIRAKDGTPLQVKLWTQNGTEFKRVSEVVQAQLKAIGMQADITVLDSSTINAQYKTGTDHQLAVRTYSWANADIIDWFFSAKRLGYPNVSMLDDPKAEELNEIAMTKSRTWDERVANFKTYHEYILSQFPFAPIYQPVTNVAYNNETLVLPDTIRGRFQSHVVMDIEVKD